MEILHIQSIIQIGNYLCTFIVKNSYLSKTHPIFLKKKDINKLTLKELFSPFVEDEAHQRQITKKESKSYGGQKGL